MLDSSRLLSTTLGLMGALAGGVFGHVLFFWVASQGFYGMILPGAFLGIGCGLLARHVSFPRGIVCGIAAFFLGLQTEWRFSPFRADSSFSYFLGHAAELTSVTQIMIVIGAFMGFWFGKDAGFNLFPKRLIQPGRPPV